jgi:hypothetical protein
MKVCIPLIGILLSLISSSLALADNAPNLGTQPYIRYWAPAGTQSLRVLALPSKIWPADQDTCMPASEGGYHDLGFTGYAGDLIVLYAYSDSNCGNNGNSNTFLGWVGGIIPSHLINTADCWFDLPRSNVSGCNGTTDPMINNPMANNGPNSLGTQPYIRYWAPTGTQSLRVVVLTHQMHFERNDCKSASDGGYHDLGFTGSVGDLIVITAYSDSNCNNSLGWAGGTIPSSLINTADCWFDLPRNNVSGCNGTTDPMN